MADIVGAADKMTDIEIGADQPHSEALMTKIGANINYLIDQRDNHENRLDDIEAIAVNTSKSSNVSSVSTTLAVLTDMTGLSRSFTSSTGVTRVTLEAGSTSVASSITVIGATAEVAILRGTTVLGIYQVSHQGALYPSSSISFLDTAATTSSVTYKIQARTLTNNGSNSISFSNCRLVCQEVK